MSGALQRCLEECLKLITLSVIGNRFAVVAVEIRPPPARTKKLSFDLLSNAFEESCKLEASIRTVVSGYPILTSGCLISS